MQLFLLTIAMDSAGTFGGDCTPEQVPHCMGVGMHGMPWEPLSIHPAISYPTLLSLNT